MADVRPFRALRYHLERAGNLSELISPPYDVIGPEERARLASHPYNVVHLILPQGPDPYEKARERLQSWISAQVLVREAEEAFYPCEQRFALPDGQVGRRLGFFARLRLEPPGRSVLAHEQTFSGPRQDRLALLRATETALEAPFLLYEDAEHSLEPLLEEALQEACWEAELGGVQHRLGRIRDPGTIRRIEALLRSCVLIIADGHHRYESLLAYREEQARQRRDPEAPFHFGLVYLSNARAPGFLVLPTHRGLVCTGGRRANWREQVPDPFRKPIADLAEGLLRLEQDPEGMLVWEPDGSIFYVGPISALAPADWPEPARSMPVVWLHEGLLAALGIREGNSEQSGAVRYYRDPEALRHALRAGELELGFLLSPPRIESIRDLCLSGRRLPQKSTYFYPKIPSGLLFYSLSDP